MKNAIVLLEGAAAAGSPAESHSLLASAHFPVLRTLSRSARIGRARLWPLGSSQTIETAVLSLAGFDAAATGVPSSAFVAVGLRQQLSESDAVFFAQLVTLDAEPATGSPLSRRPKRTLLDPAAGGATPTEIRALAADLLLHLRAAMPDLGESLDLIPVGANRFVLLERSGADYRSVVAHPPELELDEPTSIPTPTGDPRATEVLTRLLSLAESFLARHEINAARIEQGLLPANALWIWGQSRRPGLPPLASRFAISASLTTPDLAVAGVASCIGCPATRVKNPTPHSIAEATLPALAQRDLVIAHVPVRAGSDVSDSQAAAILAETDLKLIAPLADRVLRSGAGGRMLIIATPTPVKLGRRESPPQSVIALIGDGFSPSVERAFTDADAAASDLAIDPGHDLLDFFLRAGRPTPVVRVKSANSSTQEASA